MEREAILVRLPTGMKGRLKELATLKYPLAVNDIIIRSLQETLQLYNLWPLSMTPEKAKLELDRHVRGPVAVPAPPEAKPWEIAPPEVYDSHFEEFLAETQRIVNQSMILPKELVDEILDNPTAEA